MSTVEPRPMPEHVRAALASWPAPPDGWSARYYLDEVDASPQWDGRDTLPEAFAAWLEEVFDGVAGTGLSMRYELGALEGCWEAGVNVWWHTSSLGMWEAVAPTLAEAMDEISAPSTPTRRAP